MDGAYGPTLNPYRGVIAGSTTATYEVKSYLMPTITSWKLKPESSGIGLHIDDLQLHTWSESKNLCINIMKMLTVSLSAVLQTYLDCSLSAKKMT
eukprot:2231551-Pyramimonas_sp.AAC.1